MLTFAGLWKQMTPDQRLRASRAFWSDEEAGPDQVQAALLIAQRMKFRAKTVIAFDADRRSRLLATLPGMTDALAARALVAYHLAEHRPMMGDFLDALGIAHENGLVDGEIVQPAADRLGPAVAAIGAKYGRQDVSLYLNTLRCQDAETWGVLESFIN